MSAQEGKSEKLVVIDALPEGVLPRTPAEQAMIDLEPQQIELTQIYRRNYPTLLEGDPCRELYEAVRRAYADSDSQETIRLARLVQATHPLYLLAAIYEEMGMNVSPEADLDECLVKLTDTLAKAEGMLIGLIPQSEFPPADEPFQAAHHLYVIAMVRYNRSARLMAMGRLEPALADAKVAAALQADPSARMDCLLQISSLCLQLGDRPAADQALRDAKALDATLFEIKRNHLAHANPGILREDFE